MKSMWFLSLIFLQLILVQCENKSELCTRSVINHEWSPFYQILLEALSNTVKDQCISQVQAIVEGLDRGQTWTLKVFDASGSAKPTFIYGQNFWHGSQQECDFLNRPQNLMMSSQYITPIVTTLTPFEMKYTTIYVNYTTKNRYSWFMYFDVPLQLGVCMPKTCTAEQITGFARGMFSKGNLTFLRLYNMSAEVIGVKSTSLTKFMERLDTIIIFGCLLSVIAFVIAINLIALRNSGGDSSLGRFSKCFNLKTNFNKLMNLLQPRGDVVIVDAVKVFVCVVIMLSHLPVYSSYVYNNFAELLHFSYNPAYMLLSMSTLFVDFFFVISAFLQAYNFFKNDQLKTDIYENGILQNVALFLKLLMHRYIRLTPPLLLTMGLCHLTAAYMMEATTIFVEENMDVYCSPKSWWRGILYIFSFYGVEEMCGTWTWYLSAEMFYFVITLAGLFIFVKSPLAGKSLFFISLPLALCYSLYLNVIEDFQLNFDRHIKTLNTIYMAPLARIGPYFAGIFGGYFMSKWKQSAKKITKLMKYSWVTTSSLTAALVCLLVLYSKTVPQFIFQVCNSVGRFYFSCLLAWTILTYNFDDNVLFKSFLLQPVFIHLNKLSYIMYLIYPILVYYYRISSGTVVRMTISNVYVEGFGLIVFCYFVSIFLTLFFEIPFYQLSSEFLSKKKRKHQESRL